MAKLFQCPACGKQYPALPTLVARPVRCSGCKEIFRLGHDGIAVLVSAEELAAPQQAAVPQQQAPAQAAPPKLQAPAPQAAPPKPEPPAQAPKPKPEPPPSLPPKPTARKAEAPAAEAPTPRPQARDMARKREALRRSLNEAAAQAAAVTAPAATAERGTAAPPPRSGGTSRRTRPVDARPQASDRTGFEPVHSTASGGGLLVPAATIALVALVALVAWVVFRPSPEARAFDRFLADVGDGQRAFPVRHRTYLARTWLSDLGAGQEGEIVLDLDAARLGPVLRVGPDDVGEILTLLGSLEQAPDLALWVDPARLGDARAIELGLAPPTNRQALLAALAKDGIPHVDYAAVPRTLHAKSLDPVATLALSQLLVGTLADADPLAALDSGTALELRAFSGDEGRFLQHDGTTYQVADGGAYWGTLLRIGDGPWRVLAISRGELHEATASDRANPLTRRAEDHARALAAREAPAPGEGAP